MSLSYPIYKSKSYCPIENNGRNQCYIISGLQFLWSIPGINELFKSLNINDINNKLKFNSVKTDGPICKLNDKKNKNLLIAMKYIFEKFNDFKDRQEPLILDTIKVAKATGSLNVYDLIINNSTFKKFQQESSREFVELIINALICYKSKASIRDFINRFKHIEQTEVICNDNTSKITNQDDGYVLILEITTNNTSIQRSINNNKIQEESFTQYNKNNPNTKQIYTDSCPGGWKTKKVSIVQTPPLTLSSSSSSLKCHIIYLNNNKGHNVYINPSIIIGNDKFNIKCCILYIGLPNSTSGGHYIFYYYDFYLLDIFPLDKYYSN